MMIGKIASQAKVCSARASITFLFLSLAVLLGLLSGFSAAEAVDRQTTVHRMGAQVMPFDLGKTQHVFEMTQTGGIQDVIVRDPKDADQVAHIREHLRYEAARFGAGDFSDPSSLHGADMPGVKELSKGAGRIKIEYSPLPSGARITFKTTDAALVTALHRWFGAQLSDHGADATYR